MDIVLQKMGDNYPKKYFSKNSFEVDFFSNGGKKFSSFSPKISGFHISDIYTYEKNNHFRKSIAEAH
jgi:hypothetical protein